MNEARNVLAASTRTPFGVSSSFVGGAQPLSSWEDYLRGAGDLIQLGLETARNIGGLNNPTGPATQPAATPAKTMPGWVLPVGLLAGGLLVWQLTKKRGRQ